MFYLLYATGIIGTSIGVGLLFGAAAGSVFLGAEILLFTVFLKFTKDLFSLNFRNQSLLEELREIGTNPYLMVRVAVSFILIFVVPFVI
jgi:hypothetical protein